MSAGDLYAPYADMLKAGYGTLAYGDAWNIFDNIVISENLAKGSTGKLKIQKAPGSKILRQYLQTILYDTKRGTIQGVSTTYLCRK